MREAEIAHASDPLRYFPHFLSGRILDTLGRHDEAAQVFNAVATYPGMERAPVYARWYNAIWRHDLGSARTYAQAMPAEEGFRESSLAITDALADPAHWPQAKALIEQSEQRTGRPNFSRALLPDVDADVVIRAFEGPLHTLSSTYFLMLWNPEYAALRRSPAFADFLRRNRIPDYWRAHGFPPQCRPEGDGVRCD